MNLIEALNWRYAVNKFTQKKITDEHLHGLIESVRLSASAYGIQPYQLLVIENDSVKRSLLPFSYGQTKIADSSHLLILAAKTRLTQTDISQFITELAESQNQPALDFKGYEQVISGDLLAKTANEQHVWAAQQCYIALGKLLSYAAMNKIDACPMTGFDNESFDQILGLNELGLSTEIICPVGFRSSDDKYAHKAKYRKSTTDLVTIL